MEIKKKASIQISKEYSVDDTVYRIIAKRALDILLKKQHPTKEESYERNSS